MSDSRSESAGSDSEFNEIFSSDEEILDETKLQTSSSPLPVKLHTINERLSGQQIQANFPHLTKGAERTSSNIIHFPSLNNLNTIQPAMNSIAKPSAKQQQQFQLEANAFIQEPNELSRELQTFSIEAEFQVKSAEIDYVSEEDHIDAADEDEEEEEEESGDSVDEELEEEESSEQLASDDESFEIQASQKPRKRNQRKTSEYESSLIEVGNCAEEEEEVEEIEEDGGSSLQKRAKLNKRNGGVKGGALPITVRGKMKKGSEQSSYQIYSQQGGQTKGSDRIQRHQKKYAELVSLIQILPEIDWLESSGISQSKQLPVLSFTASSFWFMICSEFFPRRMVYQNEQTLLRDLRNQLDQSLAIEVINRTSKYNSSKHINTANNANNNTHDSNSMQICNNPKSVVSHNMDEETTNFTPQSQVRDERMLVQSPEIKKQLISNEYSQTTVFDRSYCPRKPIIKSECENQSLSISNEDEDYQEDATTCPSRSSKAESNSSNKKTPRKMSEQLQQQQTPSDSIRQLVKGQEDLIRVLRNRKINMTNKFSYTFEDDIYIMNQRIYLLDLLAKHELTSELQDDSEKLSQLKSIELDSLIDLLCLEHYQVESDLESMWADFESRMQQAVKEERRINPASALDFTDTLIDLRTINPLEEEFLKYLEFKQQTTPLISVTAQNNISATSIDQQLQFQQSAKKSTPNNNKITDDSTCNVCNEIDYSDNDLIVFCARCNISVHQRCYGIPQIPQGDWVCDTCLACGPSGRYLPCALCSRRGGALKKAVIPLNSSFFSNVNPQYNLYLKQCLANSARTPELFDYNGWLSQKSVSLIDDNTANATDEQQDQFFYDFQVEGKDAHLRTIDFADSKNIEHNQQQNQPVSRNIWAHLTCALWIPECYFDDKTTMSSLKGIESIDKKKFESICVVCKTSNGCCIPCVKGKCGVQFHPECARRAGLCLEVRVAETLQHIGYCLSHTPLKLRRAIQAKEKKSKDEIHKFCRSIEKYNDLYGNDALRLKVKEKLFKESKKEQKLARKFQEKESTHFIKYLSRRILDLQWQQLLEQYTKNDTIDLQSLKSVLMKFKQSALTPIISRSDSIWSIIEFNGYSDDQLFSFYQKISKKKKAEIKSVFISQKKSREKSLDEFLFKQNKSALKYMKIPNKQNVRSSVLESYSLNINQIPYGNAESSQINSIQPQKRKYQRKNLTTNVNSSIRSNSLNVQNTQNYPQNSYKEEEDEDEEFIEEEEDDDEEISENDSCSSEFSLHNEKKNLATMKLSKKQVGTQKKTKRTQKNNTPQVAAVAAIDSDVYCYCQKPYVEGQYLMQCQKCEEWYHFACIGFIGTTVQAIKSEFCCAECSPNHQMTSKKEYQKLFDKRNALYESFLEPNITKKLKRNPLCSKKSEGENQFDELEISDEILYEEVTGFYASLFLEYQLIPESRFAIQRSSEGIFSLIKPSSANSF